MIVINIEPSKTLQRIIRHRMDGEFRWDYVVVRPGEDFQVQAPEHSQLRVEVVDSGAEWR